MTGSEHPGFSVCVLITERAITVYLADFVQLNGERFYVAVDTRTATIRLERVSNDAFEQFMRNILMLGEDGSIPNGRFTKASEVSA